jgi:hypothetical protein
MAEAGTCSFQVDANTCRLLSLIHVIVSLTEHYELALLVMVLFVDAAFS